MEDILVPLFFFASVVGFPLIRREMIHRHQMERLREEGRGRNPERSLPDSVQDDTPALALKLPEPHRLYALALLCRLQDAPFDRLNAQAQFVIRQSRLEYLPTTLRAYLNLTPTARQTLIDRGQLPDTLLRDQLEQISRGVDEALGADQDATRQLLTQGQFLRDRFLNEAEGLREKVRA